MTLPRPVLALLTAVALLSACDADLPTVAATESTECTVTTSFDSAAAPTPAEAFDAVREVLAQTGPGVDDDVLDVLAEQIAEAGEGSTPIIAGAEGVIVRLTPDGDPPTGWFVSEAEVPTAC